MAHDSDATRVAAGAGSERARHVRYATGDAGANDPDATQVVTRGAVASRTPLVDASVPMSGGAQPTKPSDTAAMPGLHEAQEEVRYEAQMAQRQAQAARGGHNVAEPYATQAGAQPYGSARPPYPPRPYGQQAQPQVYGYPNPANPQAQPQGYAGMAANQYEPVQGQPYAQATQPYGAQAPAYGQPVQPVLGSQPYDAPAQAYGYQQNSGAAYQQGYAAPRQVEPVGHGRHVAARFILALFSWVFRLAAIAVSVVVVLDSFTLAAGRMELLRATAFISSLVPAQLSGLYVIDTPFGGAFRGDFAIVALVLFIVDWILCRIRAALR